MAKHAYWIGKDVNASTGGLDWEPEMDDRFRATLKCGMLSDDELQILETSGYAAVIGWLTKGRVGDVLGMSTGPYVVCKAIYEFLEREEPGLHRFFEVPVKTKKPANGTVEHGTAWLLYPPPVVDCLNFEHTTFKDDVRDKPWPRVREDTSHWGGGLSLEGDTAFNAKSITGRHLWRVATGNHPIYAKYACSEAFWAFFKADKMIGWTVEKRCLLV